ncbi:hypothetical protein L3556_11045 [Candidatus Synechococcus calcipolaris G9]|uniref:PepSY domain-containing protein n=1 Tax=Candidatus Synechococcus calcipolaris G9 TaxID=1497997 RepID=A0ABT6F0S6_9SYNE|nr:hypothetical protein [Candidatus Synechococcus calcipolaris]MDG2991461.1 hypothetical protein [Candidatus Synechococcus calcipolaris G9]
MPLHQNVNVRYHWLALLILLFTVLRTEGALASRRDAVPVDQVISCLRTATAARPGNVAEVEIEWESGRHVCEVEIYTQNREYEVEVDLSNNRVLKIEEED